MTEENRTEKLEIKHECFCQSKWIRKFLTTALGTFVGVFCALSLFAALHKPPMPPCASAHCQMMRPAMHCHHHFNKHRKPMGDFHHKKMMRDRIVPDKVKVEVKG